MGMLYLCSVGIEEVLAGRRALVRTVPGISKNGLEDNARTPSKGIKNGSEGYQERPR